eukprot:m.442604 g.442604  ORF g.442604 m.442604 type:complete len:287 (+) comp18827_c0_seq1:161-1021(+)
MGPVTLRMLPKPSWRGALVAVACLSITHGQETPTDVPSAAPSVGVSSAPSLPANSPTLGPTYNETGDTDDSTDSPTPPPTVDDEVAPCNAVQCNSTRDCAECFPANTTRYAFCDVSDSSPTQSVCLECVACEYDTSLSASEGSCAQASVCNVTEERQPPTVGSGSSNTASSNADTVTAIAVPILIVVIVLAVVGTFYFARKIKQQNTDGIKHLLSDDNEDIVVTRTDKFRGTADGIEMDDFHRDPPNPYARISLAPGQISHLPANDKEPYNNTLNGIGYLENESAI